MARHIESSIQRQCVAWFRWQYPRYALLLVANANGGKRSRIEAAIMKGEGVTAGVADLTLYLPNSEHHGLCIEMKTAKGRQSEHQKRWQKLVQGAGYRYEVCRSLEDFQSLMSDYLKKKLIKNIPQRNNFAKNVTIFTTENQRIMNYEQKTLPITKLVSNSGQIAGVPKNPRTIKDARFRALVKSIEDAPEMLSLRELIVVPKEGKYVTICGNMRLSAARELGMKDMPCKVLAEDTPAEKLREYAMKDNIAFGQDDIDLILAEWDSEELAEWGFELPEEEVVEEQPEVKEDDFNHEEAEKLPPRVKRGEVWQLGNHRLMCGDSTSAEDVEKLRGGELADLVFTDPPYGVSIGDKNATLNSVQPSGRCVTNIENDTLSADALYPILVKAMTNARLSCKDDASYYVTSPQGGELGLMMMMMMKDAGLPVRHMLIWEKNSATFSLGRLDYDYQHEPIFYTWTKKHHNYRKGEYRTTIWKYDKPRKCDLHPTMKPVALVANAMLDATKEGDVVLDLFGGSGTTLIAAEQNNRKAMLMELDPHYCDVIIARWETLTGKQAVKIA